jgi:hypothetical protein
VPKPLYSTKVTAMEGRNGSIRSDDGLRAARGISRSLSIAILLLTCGSLCPQNLSAQNQDHRVRNIVLVHGAWADGSGWKGVYDILVKDGYNVSIVQEPETSFLRRPLKKMWAPAMQSTFPIQKKLRL